MVILVPLGVKAGSRDRQEIGRAAGGDFGMFARGMAEGGEPRGRVRELVTAGREIGSCRASHRSEDLVLGQAAETCMPVQVPAKSRSRSSACAISATNAARASPPSGEGAVSTSSRSPARSAYTRRQF